MGQSSSAMVLRALDLLERGIVLVLFGVFVARMAPQYRLFLSADAGQVVADGAALAAAAGAILLVVSETLAVALILARRASVTVSASPLDWLLAFAGTSAGLLVQPTGPGVGWAVALGQLMMLSGLCLQIWGKVALWRSFGVVPANRGVRTGGPYRALRHPIYAGYSLTHFGFVIGYFSLYNLVLYTSVLLIDLARLLREEQVLGADAGYARYAERVKYRLIPYVF